MNTAESKECYFIKVDKEITKLFKSILKPVSKAIQDPQNAVKNELSLLENISW